MTPTDPLLEPAALERLTRLQLVARRRFRGEGGGERAGRRLGGRGEFSGHARYSPGDDFRAIDWNLAARLETIHVRQYHREESIPVRIVLDASASMSFGTPPKFDQARRIAAGLAVIALARRHAVSLWTTALPDSVEGGRRVFRGPAGQRALLETLRALDPDPPGAALDAAAALRDLQRRDPVSSFTVWLTDGHGGDPVRRVLARQLARTDDATMVLVAAPEEAEPPLEGNVRLLDAETGEAIDLAIGPGEIDAYRRAYTAFVEDWRLVCGRAGVRFARVGSDEDLQEVFFGALTRARVLG